MNATQSKQLIAAARVAIEILPRCDARIQLAKALNALRAQTPKLAIVKSSGLEPFPSIRKILKMSPETLHKSRAAGFCYCSVCAPIRKQESAMITLLMTMAGYKFPTFRPAPGCGTDFAAMRARLEKCACGHNAGSHTKDELENLLTCNGTGCDCDHFHYQTNDTTISAAAGR